MVLTAEHEMIFISLVQWWRAKSNK